MVLNRAAQPSLGCFDSIFRDKSVFVTGHTGFKGGWLCEWLLALGARVTGFGLPANTEPALFDQLGLATRLEAHYHGDINNATTLRAALHAAQPDFVFHLAAQPLVRLSYREPLSTFATNVMGTANVLEALRDYDRPCAAIFVTTDKCYENREWVHGYRETDPLGGHDPYSASKAAAELLVASYRASFFGNHPVRIASGRAGNVIGGGDFALDRIVPDCARALAHGDVIRVRNKAAVRPWQHVLEPLSGYLALAARLAAGADVASAFNFGPGNDGNRSVAQLVTEMLQHWPGEWEDRSEANAVHEAGLLQLSIDKAQALLGWSPVWNFRSAVKATADWYRRAHESPAEARRFTQAQIRRYCADAFEQKLSWASEPAVEPSSRASRRTRRPLASRV